MDYVLRHQYPIIISNALVCFALYPMLQYLIHKYHMHLVSYTLSPAFVPYPLVSYELVCIISLCISILCILSYTLVSQAYVSYASHPMQYYPMHYYPLHYILCISTVSYAYVSYAIQYPIHQYPIHQYPINQYALVSSNGTRPLHELKIVIFPLFLVLVHLNNDYYPIIYRKDDFLQNGKIFFIIRQLSIHLNLGQIQDSVLAWLIAIIGLCLKEGQIMWYYLGENPPKSG